MIIWVRQCWNGIELCVLNSAMKVEEWRSEMNILTVFHWYFSLEGWRPLVFLNYQKSMYLCTYQSLANMTRQECWTKHIDSRKVSILLCILSNFLDLVNIGLALIPCFFYWKFCSASWTGPFWGMQVKSVNWQFKISIFATLHNNKIDGTR